MSWCGSSPRHAVHTAFAAWEMQALDYIKRAGGLERAKELAARHTASAVAAARSLPDSESRTALVQLADSLLLRTH